MSTHGFMTRGLTPISAGCRGVSWSLGLGFMVCVALGAGCHNRTITSEAMPNYQTVPDHPQRDESLAQKENTLALRHLKEGQWDQAEAAFKKALAADVTFGPAHNNLGKVYYHQSKFYLAAWEFQYAIQLMPHHPEPRNNLGLVYEAVGQLNDAVTRYEEALEMQPDNPQLLGNLARARYRRGDRGDEVRGLLADLILKDTRPQWVDWAKQTLVKLSHP